MQLDYKDIIIKHYALLMSGSETAHQTGFGKSGVNDFLRAFKKCEDLRYPLPAGITNYGIALKVYGSVPGSGGRNENIELPDYEEAAKLMVNRKNMTLMFLWNRYQRKFLQNLDPVRLGASIYFFIIRGSVTITLLQVKNSNLLQRLRSCSSVSFSLYLAISFTSVCWIP